jgi:hypothetical protein
VPVAGAAYAAERKLDFRAGGAVIDIHQSRKNIAHGGESLVDVLGEDRSRESVFGSIIDLDRLCERLDFDDR